MFRRESMVEPPMPIEIERRSDALTLNTDEVRKVVRDENRGLTEGINGLMSATREMTTAIHGLVTQSRVNDEKFANMHKQIHQVGTEADATNQALLKLSTDVIPAIEQQVALNGFSVGAFWKGAAVVITPLAAVAAYLYKEIIEREEHIVLLMKEMHEIISKI